MEDAVKATRELTGEYEPAIRAVASALQRAGTEPLSYAEVCEIVTT